MLVVRSLVAQPAMMPGKPDVRPSLRVPEIEGLPFARPAH